MENATAVQIVEQPAQPTLQQKILEVLMSKEFDDWFNLGTFDHFKRNGTDEENNPVTDEQMTYAIGQLFNI